MTEHGRNAAFCDLMARTGLRLGVYSRRYLPGSITSPTAATDGTALCRSRIG
ncbi:hypothetical protein J6K27_005883 (plasmid) [Rhodococcus qingshengii]|uniref:hypothetical protein n=1 Tax=Rhodococcus qingshengii TaxID=334542 RepID=UPI00042A50E4|nr:hypothetical protein [Rhodococcus qingshengii]QTS03671.1 hypothetical protein J6K27_005883 [Rhodococcus qingshengii]